MHVKVVLTEKNLFAWKRALTWDDRKEKAVHILCHSATDGDSIKLLPHEFIVPHQQDYENRSAGYYCLKKSFVDRVINEAVSRQLDLIQSHVHPGDPGIFSAVDAVREPMFMRHIAEKVNEIYHGSLVFGNSLNTLDGWFYDRETDQLVEIEKVLAIGNDNLKIHIPHRSKLQNISVSPVTIRTSLAIGKASVKDLGAIDCGVVGASALGGPILEMLARDGVKSITVCDPDVIDETNLNRLPGTTLKDIGRPKVEFYADLIRRVNPELKVVAFQKSFYEPEVQSAFAQVDVIFGCVDSGARLSINRLALANLIPYFDMGVAIKVDNGKLSFAGGQVYSVIPGRGVCLNCSGAFDHLLTDYISPNERKLRESRGYVQAGSGFPEPSVMYLDYIVTGLGYGEFLKYVVGYAKPPYKIYFNQVPNRLVPSGSPSIGCVACRPDDYLGKGDKVPAMVPEKPIEDFGPSPKDLQMT